MASEATKYSGSTEVSTDQIIFSEHIEGEESQAYSEIPLDAEEGKKKKVPRRIIHFSDGVVEEYSTDEEDNAEPEPEPLVDPKTLDWLPWLWFYLWFAGIKSLAAMDVCGEKLAWFFGITSPKYQYAIDEYYKLREEDEEEERLAALENELETEMRSTELKEMEDGIAVISNGQIQVEGTKKQNDNNQGMRPDYDVIQQTSAINT